MRVLMYYSNKDVRLEEMDVPSVGEGEMLMRIEASGICGSDVHYFEEGRFGSFAVTAR